MVHKPKKRRRTKRSKADMDRLREAIWDICHEHQPLTVRNLFYRLVVEHLIEKSQREYNNVAVRLTGLMREADELPWQWIVDSTRWMRKPLTGILKNSGPRIIYPCWKSILWVISGH